MSEQNDFVTPVDEAGAEALAEVERQNAEYAELADDPESLTAAMEGYMKAQELEYSKYVATGPVWIDGAPAFLAGMAVPASHVERMPDLVEEGYVVKREDYKG